MKPKKTSKGKRNVQPPPPVPDLMNDVTMEDLSAGGWARRRGKKDPYKHVRPHPNAVAIRKLRAGLAAMGMPHSHPREYFGEKEAYWDFQNCVEYGLNPYDFDKFELERLKDEAYRRHKAEEKARREREAEELRRNPPPPPPPYLACRIVGNKPFSASAKRVPELALHARYGKRWKLLRREVPEFERFLRDAITREEIPKPKPE